MLERQLPATDPRAGPWRRAPRAGPAHALKVDLRGPMSGREVLVLRLVAPLLLLLGAFRAEAQTATLRLWTHGPDLAGADPRSSFVLLIPRDLDHELEALAAECGYRTRPATADDLRESYPVLSAREVALPHGRRAVTWDLRYSRHVAMMQLVAELRALEAGGIELGPAARAYLASR